jgi:hypothetical protein
MSDARTDNSFRQAKADRESQEAVTADAFRDALVSTNTCMTRAAFKLGMNESAIRKMRAGDMHIALHDVERMAEHEPALFIAILERLAGLAKRRVVDVNDDAPQADRLARAASVAKEGGEAIAAIVAAEIANDPAADVAAIREGEEGIAKLGAAVEAAKSRRAKHLELVVARNAPRERTNRC